MKTMELERKVENGSAVVCVVGLGYVGLPLLSEFSKQYRVIGFDVNERKVSKLKEGIDETCEIKESEMRAMIDGGRTEFTSDPSKISEADIIIVCVPTPVTSNNSPDLKFIVSAAELIGKHIKSGSVVVLESTVYPGVTEDVMGPAIEGASGKKAGEGFALGYSPERINPGDKQHGLKEIIKVVSGSDPEVTDLLSGLYGKIAKAGVFKAKSIKTAEAAKVIENIQRDLNIALVNELSLIFSKMGIDTTEVLKAAETKWNFHSYRPGLVGGHCIPVDPYYLVHAARQVGYDPRVILAGRDTNNYMPTRVVELVISSLNERKKPVKDSNILLMGLTFKKNVKDIRNTPASTIISELKKLGANVTAFDPLVDASEAEDIFKVKCLKSMSEAKDMDCVIIVTDHDVFREIELANLGGRPSERTILVDVRRIYDTKKASDAGFDYVAL